MPATSMKSYQVNFLGLGVITRWRWPVLSFAMSSIHWQFWSVYYSLLLSCLWGAHWSWNLKPNFCHGGICIPTLAIKGSVD